MNKLNQILFRIIPAVALVFSCALSAQTQKKTYSETFSVDGNTVLNINTSHTDIEFDTWNKNQVLVEAVIELEGASEEEAEKYFKNNGIKILGNSSEIEISSRSGGPWSTAHIAGVPGYTDDMVIEIPDIPDVEPFFIDIEIPDLPDIPMLADVPPMPPMPPMHIGEFDYQEYQERGEEYLEEWRNEFQKTFDDEWAEEMKEWGEQLKANMKEHQDQQKEHLKEREEIMKEHEKEREELMKEAEELREEAMEEHKKAMEEARKVREEEREVHRNVIISSDKAHAPKIYYQSSDGKSRNYKVKRSIKIKMPKSVKLNMNVRHGEVKLAENTVDINATLSYARLLASTIDGDETSIEAAYTPVSVQQWNLGKLNTKFSEDIALKDVKYLTLDAISSEVTINRLLKSAKVKNNLGSLHIQAVSPDFKEIDISVQNGQLECVLPAIDYNIYAKGTYSDFSFPSELTLEKSENGSQTVYKGYNLKERANRSIVINSKYSEVVLEN
ncbi:MAG: hypothetical protein ACR2MM_00755 [Flavobacteriaceae bacterium]